MGPVLKGFPVISNSKLFYKMHFLSDLECILLDTVREKPEELDPQS